MYVVWWGGIDYYHNFILQICHVRAFPSDSLICMVVEKKTRQHVSHGRGKEMRIVISSLGFSSYVPLYVKWEEGKEEGIVACCLCLRFASGVTRRGTKWEPTLNHEF